MNTLLLKLAGPLQSWGTSSHFENRYTDRFPSKSGVIGMIAAALGIRRDDSESLNKLNQVDFAVRIDQPGTLAIDYHIARKLKNDGSLQRSYVTNRYYLQDAVFVIAITGEDSIIETIENGLKNQYFQPFLGRRSNPLNADFIIGTSCMGAVESIKTHPWEAADWYRNKNKKKKYMSLEVYTDGDLVNGQVMSVRDRPITFSQKSRKHGFRSIKRIHVVVENERYIDEDTEHDAFKAIGG